MTDERTDRMEYRVQRVSTDPLALPIIEAVVAYNGLPSPLPFGAGVYGETLESATTLAKEWNEAHGARHRYYVARRKVGEWEKLPS